VVGAVVLVVLSLKLEGPPEVPSGLGKLVASWVVAARCNRGRHEGQGQARALHGARVRQGRGGVQGGLVRARWGA
jgi:hypothetical protein